MSTNDETTNPAHLNYRQLQEVLRRTLEAFKGVVAENGVADEPRWKPLLDLAEALRPMMEMDPPQVPQIWREAMQRLRGLLRELRDAWAKEATGKTTLRHPDWYRAWLDASRLLDEPMALDFAVPTESLHVVGAAPTRGKTAVLAQRSPGLILRPTQWTLQPPNEPIHGQGVTVLTVEDDGGGEYLSVEQADGTGKICIDPEAWPLLREAVDAALLDLQGKGGAA